MPNPSKAITVTLKRVALDAGVSYQTVWRALHDTAGILPDTRQHVLDVATKLGYRRNITASSLRTARSHIIGLVVLDVSNSYTGELVGGVEAAATRAGCSVMLMNSGDDLDRERRAVHSLLDRQVDGIIINPSSLGDHSYLVRDLPDGLPLVSINRPIPGVPCATVQSRHDDVALAAAHLVKSGHERIGGIFGEPGNTAFRERNLSLQRALKRSGRRVPARWFCHGPNTVDFGRQATCKMLAAADSPTALFTGGNRLTEGALLGLRDMGLRQGIDIGLVGFDLRYAQLLDPPMPVLLQPGHAMGCLAAEALLAARSGEPVPNLSPLPLHFETYVTRACA